MADGGIKSCLNFQPASWVQPCQLHSPVSQFLKAYISLVLSGNPQLGPPLPQEEAGTDNEQTAGVRRDSATDKEEARRRGGTCPRTAALRRCCGQGGDRWTGQEAGRERLMAGCPSPPPDSADLFLVHPGPT